MTTLITAAKETDYMRPVRTETGTTSDRSPYKCLFLFTLGRSEKPSHAGFTHSGC